MDIDILKMEGKRSIGGGFIGYFGLSEWFSSLSEDEKQKMRTYFSGGGLREFEPENVDGFEISVEIGRNPNELEHGNLPMENRIPKLTGAHILSNIGLSALHNNDYDFAKKILDKAFESKDCNPTDRHFIYNSLIDLYYKQRDTLPDAIDKCIRYCKEDIEHLEDFLEVYREENIKYGRKFVDPQYQYPIIPSIKRLILIYEKQGKIKEAIEICDIAINYNLTDTHYTKGGFECRKARLQNKLL